jgi:hypothetical protein
MSSHEEVEFRKSEAGRLRARVDVLEADIDELERRLANSALPGTLSNGRSLEDAALVHWRSSSLPAGVAFDILEFQKRTRVHPAAELVVERRALLFLSCSLIPLRDSEHLEMSESWRDQPLFCFLATNGQMVCTIVG